jgi:hypothetical protein
VVILVMSTVASPLLWASPGELAAPPGHYYYIASAALDFGFLFLMSLGLCRLLAANFRERLLSAYFGE